MPLVKHENAKPSVGPRRTDFLERFFDDVPGRFRRPWVVLADESMEPIRVDEFSEGEELVIRVELAGIDPDKDVDISVSGDALHISAERHEKEDIAARDYVRHELRYGSFHRDLPLPTGVTEQDVKATYTDGILEVRIPAPTSTKSEPKKVVVNKT